MIYYYEEDDRGPNFNEVNAGIEKCRQDAPPGRGGVWTATKQTTRPVKKRANKKFSPGIYAVVAARVRN